MDLRNQKNPAQSDFVENFYIAEKPLSLFAIHVMGVIFKTSNSIFLLLIVNLSIILYLNAYSIIFY
jgi:hypothetical protein